MTDIKTLDVALRLAGFNFTKEAVELILRIHSLVEEKGGKTTLEEVTAIVTSNEQKYKEKE